MNTNSDTDDTDGSEYIEYDSDDTDADQSNSLEVMDFVKFTEKQNTEIKMSVEGSIYSPKYNKSQALSAQGLDFIFSMTEYLPYKIQDLSLENFHLQPMLLPSSMFQLQDIKNISMEQMHMISISNEISKLTNLTFLSISQSLFTAIPPSIFEIKSLRCLQMTKCYINQVDPDISKLSKLTFLNLSNNFITSVPLSLTSMTDLKYLSIYNNPLPLESYEIIELSGFDIHS
jgi:Leucine-rich repeat (LRR) protein